MNPRTRHLKFERTFGITYINHHFFYFLNFWQPVGLKKGKKSQSLKLQTQLIFNGQFFCIKKAQHPSITGRTEAKFVSPLCFLSSHERLNGEQMKIKLYLEVFIYSMMFDFFISLRTQFCRYVCFFQRFHSWKEHFVLFMQPNSF